jgi:hypothetical protein
MRAESFYSYRQMEIWTDGQTDMAKLIVASRNFTHVSN